MLHIWRNWKNPDLHHTDCIHKFCYSMSHNTFSKWTKANTSISTFSIHSNRLHCKFVYGPDKVGNRIICISVSHSESLLKVETTMYFLFNCSGWERGSLLLSIFLYYTAGIHCDIWYQYQKKNSKWKAFTLHSNSLTFFPYRHVVQGLRFLYATFLTLINCPNH